MQKLFANGRIRGVSFRRNVTRSHGQRASISAPLPEGFSLTHKMLDDAKPPHLCTREVRKLLLDTRRHEVHALVSETIEHLSHWKQISHALDSYLLLDANGRSSSFNWDDDVPRNHEERRLLAVEVRSVFLMWRHRLSMLELIADAQPFLGYETLR